MSQDPSPCSANDMYIKTLSFKLFWCQPELVEGGVIIMQRHRQAQTDTPI